MFPKDYPLNPVPMTAGMTFIVREVDGPGSKSNKKEIVEGVTSLPMFAIIVVAVREEEEQGEAGEAGQGP